MITSTANVAIARIRTMRTRKGRAGSGLFLAEGIRLVTEAVESCPADIDSVILAPGLLTSAFAQSVVERARTAGIPVLEVSDRVFASLSSRDGPQGIAVVAQQRIGSLSHVEPPANDCWVALDGAAGPGNIGSIARTADATGCAGLILLGPTADPYDPEAVRASMGALFTQQLVRATFVELVEWVHRHGCSLIGTSGAASQEYTDVPYRRPAVLLMGSEREGLSAAQQAACDVVIRIPMLGRCDSLNLAVATGVVLYGMLNTWRT